MYKFKEYTDEEFFGCKLRGANNVVNAVIGGATDEGGHYANIPPSILENAARRGKAVHEAIEKFEPANGQEKHLVHMLRYYHPDEDHFDDHMVELLQMGQNEDHLWERFR